ncbi:hypothetical protein V6N12_003027 [Hibiscus sabdariffa]|uniref:Uncharacterized protein n=1 Tax=Hibiscus sabdariffa TaxID=183260 RepID=A0ABR2EC76_9ROSI
MDSNSEEGNHMDTKKDVHSVLKTMGPIDGEENMEEISIEEAVDSDFLMWQQVLLRDAHETVKPGKYLGLRGGDSKGHYEKEAGILCYLGI